MLTRPGHWVFAPEIQSVLYQKNIPFHIRNTDSTADKSLQRTTGQAVPVVQYNSPPPDSKVILNVIKRGHSKQVSVHPRHLVPWEPVVGGEVVVTKKGLIFGAMGVASIKTANQWVVTLSIDNDAKDYIFEENELTALEARR